MSTPKNALSSSGQLKAVSRQHELAMQSEVIMRHPEGESDLSTACCSRTAAASRDLRAAGSKESHRLDRTTFRGLVLGCIAAKFCR